MKEVAVTKFTAVAAIANVALILIDCGHCNQLRETASFLGYFLIGNPPASKVLRFQIDYHFEFHLYGQLLYYQLQQHRRNTCKQGCPHTYFSAYFFQYFS